MRDSDLGVTFLRRFAVGHEQVGADRRAPEPL